MRHIAVYVRILTAANTTEGALWGSVQAHEFLCDAVVLSDDAGQFNIGRHALCWVHAERLVHKLDTFNDLHRAAQTRVQSLIWDFYADLKAYQLRPGKRRAFALRARFDRIFIFLRRTGFVTLDRLLARLHANKAELLMVLDRPEIPLHTKIWAAGSKLSGTRSSNLWTITSERDAAPPDWCTHHYLCSCDRVPSGPYSSSVPGLLPLLRGRYAASVFPWLT